LGRRCAPAVDRSVSAALSTELGQAVLFDIAGSLPLVPSCPQDETITTLSVMRDKKGINRLDTLVRRLRRARTPLDQALLAAEVRTVADRLVGDSIREANNAGQTWRQIGAELGVPFQTLYRRYGTAEAGQKEA
jgi:hypothetical protein